MNLTLNGPVGLSRWLSWATLGLDRGGSRRVSRLVGRRRVAAPGQQAHRDRGATCGKRGDALNPGRHPWTGSAYAWPATASVAGTRRRKR